MDDTTSNTSPSQPQQGVKFDNSFTPLVDTYIQECTSKNIKPTVKGFATKIGTDVFSLWQWANKNKKDNQGNVTAELARPNFNTALTKLDTLEKQEKQDKLNPQQDLFCQLYATSKEHFGNATHCYGIAYGIDITTKEGYASAQASSSALLLNLIVLKRIDHLLEDTGDEVVDQELAFVIRQRYELPSKIAAIREYNKVKGRITDKIDHTTKGEKLPTPIYGSKSTV